MKTGGECENCGSWFETQRYEDQGYGLCPGCDERSKRETMTQPDSIMSAEEFLLTLEEHCYGNNDGMTGSLYMPSALEKLTAYREAVRNAALEEQNEKIQKLEALLLIVKSCCTDENLGTKNVTLNYPSNQIKLSDAIEIALKMKTPSKEGV